MANHLESPCITLIQVFDKSFCQTDQIHDRRERTLHDHLKVYKPPTTSLDLESEGTQVACDLTGSEPDTQSKHTTRPGPPRGVTMTYFARAEYIARLLLAPGP
jgi:hypothetical protein